MGFNFEQCSLNAVSYLSDLDVRDLVVPKEKQQLGFLVQPDRPVPGCLGLAVDGLVHRRLEVGDLLDDLLAEPVRSDGDPLVP